MPTYHKNPTKENLMYQAAILSRNIERMYEERDKIQEKINRIEAKEIMQKSINS